MLKFLGQIAQGLKVFDSDTQLLFLRFVMRAGRSPDPNRFVQDALAKVLSEDEPPPAPPRQVQVSWREVKK